ncbi:unnamed protein product [Polarella glacialis]|uniref:Uncharacterized protein n=1 Tax=Polarella glacialis TaxID=89957 RepID=A0A813LJG2_POLGL|nr:unnamed protein product [Polarella glacialis]
MKQLARIAHKTAVNSSGEDLRMVRGICAPKVIAPLVAHIAAGTVLSDSLVARAQSAALAEVPDAMLALLTLLPEREQIKNLSGTLGELMKTQPDKADERFEPGVNKRTLDAIRTWVSRTMLVFYSAALLNEFERHYPRDAALEQGPGEEMVRQPLCIMVPGAQSVKITCIKKQVLSLARADNFGAGNLLLQCISFLAQHRTRRCLAKAVPALCICKARHPLVQGFDKKMSRGGNKEVFKMKVEPHFMFGVVRRVALEDFFAAGHFKRLVDLLLPAPPDDPSSVRGVPFGVIKGINWLYNVIAFELESVIQQLRPEPIQALTPENCTVFPILRVMRAIVYRVVASRPGEADYEDLRLQMQCAEVTIYTFARSMAFKESFLGGQKKWKHLPLLLDAGPLVDVSSAFLVVFPDHAFLLSSRKIDDEVARVLTPVVSVYGDLMEGGWEPTYEETTLRPKHGSTSLRDPANEGSKSVGLGGGGGALLLIGVGESVLD